MRSNEIVHGLFTNIKFLYEKTGNTYLDKYFCIYNPFLKRILYFIIFIRKKIYDFYGFINNYLI